MKYFCDYYRKLSLTNFFTAFTIVTFIGGVLAQTEIADAKFRGETLDTWIPWFWTFSSTYSYAFLCPIIVICCQKWALDRKNILGTTVKLVLLYVPYTTLFIILMVSTRQAGHVIVDGAFHDLWGWWDRYIYELPKTMPFYLAIIFASYAKRYYFDVQQAAIKTAKLNEALAVAQMDVLRNQLNPHFLSNTLNLISSTMYVSVDRADSIITRLGDVLRYSLITSQQPWVKLEEEMVIMMSFLEIAKLRFEDKMVIDVNISPEVKCAKIPAMILQPLLENAVKYGIEPSDQTSIITLKASLIEGSLFITISNTYHKNASAVVSHGIGLENTKKRLHILYGDKGKLSLNEPKLGMTTVDLVVPFDKYETV